MGSTTAKRRLVVYVTLIGCGLAVCGWQAQEHVRFKRNAAEALINRGRDITSTLGVVVRSQRRFGPNVVLRDRVQSARVGGSALSLRGRVGRIAAVGRPRTPAACRPWRR